MFCSKCGAPLRDSDRFCSKCGAKVDRQPVQTEERPVFEYQKKPVYYDEKLYRDDRKLERKSKDQYRDTFLEEKEDRSHALLTTVAILLLIAVLTAGVVILYFFYQRDHGTASDRRTVSVKPDASSKGGEIIILSGGEVVGVEETEDHSEGSSIVIISEENTGSDKELQTAAADSKAAEKQTETETEKTTEAETKQEEQKGPDMKKIREILDTQSTATKAEVYIYDMKTDTGYELEGSSEPMYASAMITVPILYTAASLLDQHQITLNDGIVYVNSIGGRGEANPELREGQTLSLSYYLTTMTRYSDNNCMNCLIDYLGLDRINQTCQEAGFGSVRLERKIVDQVTDGKDNYVSAKDLAGMVKDLYLGRFQTIGKDFIRSYFKIDEGDGYPTVIGLAPSLANAVLLNQNGRTDSRYNEVAVITDDSHSYIVSIMCNGEYGFAYEEAIQNISDLIYQSL